MLYEGNHIVYNLLRLASREVVNWPLGFISRAHILLKHVLCHNTHTPSLVHKVGVFSVDKLMYPWHFFYGSVLSQKLAIWLLGTQISWKFQLFAFLRSSRHKLHCHDFGIYTSKQRLPLVNWILNLFPHDLINLSKNHVFHSSSTLRAPKMALGFFAICGHLAVLIYTLVLRRILRQWKPRGVMWLISKVRENKAGRGVVTLRLHRVFPLFPESPPPLHLASLFWGYLKELVDAGH